MRSLSTILVLDEDPTLRYSLALILEQANYEITAAASQQEALGNLNKHCYDLILLDISMPEKGEPAILSEIQRLCPQTPILILTADVPFEITKGTRPQNVIGFLSKPINPKCLLAEIHSRLHERHIPDTQANRQAMTPTKPKKDEKSL